nr:MAG TPA: hypothetical protein [Caudoviricetes sp.]
MHHAKQFTHIKYRKERCSFLAGFISRSLHIVNP